MDDLFELNVSNDKMTASLTLREGPHNEAEVTIDDMKNFLNKRKISFGIKEENLRKIISGINVSDYPVIIAEGIPPIHGSNGYLIDKTVSGQRDPVLAEGEKNVNFRNVNRIPSVKAGQLLADIIPPKPGIPGKSVYGTPIPAKNGKVFRLKAGKNVLFHSGQVLATMDGQVSFTTNSINVFPIFEVNGDLDLKTGNVDFIGNVVIRGNVPPGYEIKAGGDINISGLVENSVLSAGGSIVIGGGITGTGQSYVEAGVDIRASYLNQANVKAGGEIIIDSSIHHSRVLSESHVICKKGHIIGGEIEAYKGVETNDIGNLHYTQTLIQIGNYRNCAARETEIHTESKMLNDSLSKLSIVCRKLEVKKESIGDLSSQEKMIYEKGLSTEKAIHSKMEKLTEELEQLRKHYKDIYLVAKGRIFPNTQIHMGKYRKPVPSVIQQTKLFISDGEIVSIPL